MIILEIMMRTFLPTKDFVLAIARDFSYFNIADKSAALAYRALFALVPILILIISVASLYNFGALATSGIEEFFSRYFGIESAYFFEQVVKVANSNTSLIAAIIGFVLVMYGAVGFFLTIQRSLFEIFASFIQEKNPIRNILYTYVYSIAYLVIFLFFIISLFIARLYLVSSIEFLEDVFNHSLSATAIRGLTAVVMLILLTVYLGISYRFFSRHTLRLLDAFIGGLAASIMILLLNNSLALYFSFSNVISLYGTATFLVVILFWVYFFSMILFLGALIARGASKV